MGDRLQDLEEGVHEATTEDSWMHRHLADSVYLWACGEKAHEQDADPKLCDRLIGWLVLLMQGLSYAMLLVLARCTSNDSTASSADDSQEFGHLWPSVAGALYLLVASTAHDLRAGFKLLVDGPCPGHHAFGLGLLVVYGIMIGAAITVLLSTSDDSAAVVLNGVTVLFVADLDEKVLNLLVTVPHKWRLFWVLESAGISLALALITIYYTEDASPLLEGTNVVLKAFPTWFVWAVNPAAVTLCAVVGSSAMQAVCNFLSEACETVDEPSFHNVVNNVYEVFVAAVKRAMQSVRRDPCFHLAQAMWLVHAIHSWKSTVQTFKAFPVAVVFSPSSSESENASIVVSDNRAALVYANVELVVGLAVKAWGGLRPRHRHVAISPERPSSSEPGLPREEQSDCADSCVSSLLVGSGIGYWVTSLLYVFGCSWPGGGCGWDNAPIVVTGLGYVVVPCFLVASIFMVADIDFLGTRFGAFVKPAVDTTRDWRRVEFWIMAAVLRDFMDAWIALCKASTLPSN